MAFSLAGALALLTPALASLPSWLQPSVTSQLTSSRRLEHEYEDLVLESCSSFPAHLCSNGVVDNAQDVFCRGEGEDGWSSVARDCVSRCRDGCTAAGNDGCIGIVCDCECDPVRDKEACCKPAHCGLMDPTRCPSGILIDYPHEKDCLTSECSQADVGTCCRACDLCGGYHLLPNEYEQLTPTGVRTAYCPSVQEVCTISAAKHAFAFLHDDFDQQCRECADDLDFDRQACCSASDTFIPTRLFVTEHTYEHERHGARPPWEKRNGTFISLPTDCGDLTDNEWAMQEEYFNREYSPSWPSHYDSLVFSLRQCLGMCLRDSCCLAARIDLNEASGACFLQNDCVMDAFFDHRGEFDNRETYDASDTFLGLPCESFSQCTFFRTSMDEPASECFNGLCPQVEVNEVTFTARPQECSWETRQEWYEAAQQAATIVLVVSIVGSCCYCCCCLGCCWFCYKQNQKSKMQSVPAGAPAVPVAQTAAPAGQVVGVATPAVPMAQAVAVPATAVAVPVAQAVAVAVPVEADAAKRFCTNCGKALAPGMAFCSECGTKVQGAAPAAACAPPTEPE